MDVAPIGYKIGATSPEAQRIIGCDGPFYGPMFDLWFHDSGDTLPLPETVLGAECEFAFRLGADLPPRNSDYSRDDVLDAVASCHPAIEIVGRRSQSEGFPPFLHCVADFALHHAFINGAPVDDWRGRDLSAITVSAMVDGEVTNSGSGAEVLGDPVNALLWIANTRRAEGRGLQAGMWITTGTCLGVVPTRPGTTIVGRFEGFGDVEVTFA